MNFSYLSDGLHDDKGNDISGDKGSSAKSCSKRVFDEEVCGADNRLDNNCKPVEASIGAQIIANEVGVSQWAHSFLVFLR